MDEFDRNKRECPVYYFKQLVVLVLMCWCLKDMDEPLNIKKKNEIELIYIRVCKIIRPSICLLPLVRLEMI